MSSAAANHGGRKPPPERKPGPRRTPGGVIRSDESYHVDDFLSRVGWAKGALRTARRSGLRVVKAGGRHYILGSDWLEYLRRIAAGQGGEG